MDVRFIYIVSYRDLGTVLRVVFTKRTYIQDVRSFKWKRLSCILFAYNYLDIRFFQMHFPKPNYGPIILNYNQDQNDRLVSLYKMVVLTQFRKNGVYGLLKSEPNRWMGSWGQPAKCRVASLADFLPNVIFWAEFEVVWQGKNGLAVLASLADIWQILFSEA